MTPASGQLSTGAPPHPSRPRLVAILLVALLFVQCTLGTLITLDDTDPSLTWGPPSPDSNVPTVLPPQQCASDPDASQCEGHWWTEGGEGTRTFGLDYMGTIHDTFGPNTTLEFSFKGSSLSIYGTTLDYGASFFITIDDGTPINVNTTQGYLQTQQLLFSQPGLDAKVTHTVKLEYDKRSFTPRRWLGIDYIQYESGEAGAVDTSYLPTTTAPASTPTSPPGSSRPAIQTVLASTLGSLGGGIVVFALVVLIVRRVRKPRMEKVRPQKAASSAGSVWKWRGGVHDDRTSVTSGSGKGKERARVDMIEETDDLERGDGASTTNRSRVSTPALQHSPATPTRVPSPLARHPSPSSGSRLYHSSNSNSTLPTSSQPSNSAIGLSRLVIPRSNFSSNANLPPSQPHGVPVPANHPIIPLLGPPGAGRVVGGADDGEAQHLREKVSRFVSAMRGSGENDQEEPPPPPYLRPPGGAAAQPGG